MNDVKIAFLGAGNMGQAIINGMIKAALVKKENIFFYEPNETLSNKIASESGVTPIRKIDETMANFDILILAVKPQIFNSFGKDPVMGHLQTLITAKQVVVSIMAGITINALAAFFKNVSEFVRIMPNTPALIGEGMSVLAPSPAVTQPHLDIVKTIFTSIGAVETADERYMDAVTGLSGSGPAYVLMFIEALTQGGILCGLAKPVAEKLAIQTVLGTSMMARSSDKSVEELRHMVTSPGGTTIAGIATLEDHGFRSGVINGVKAAYMRSKELGS